MATVAKTVTGARAKLFINGQLCGIYGNVSYSVNYDTQPIYILGRYNAAEIVYTGMGTVDVQASGFRVMANGPYATTSVPKLQDLLNHQDIVLALIDRQATNATQANVMTVTGVRPTSFSIDVTARGVAALNASFSGLVLTDETGLQEDQNAVNFG